ncbi:MAG TPA: ferritin-like domain-containing protein [Candidatus Brocadiia bacterium]|nr:ferritin-like domain-containing protein [Candidatus Brocadiia bacterium]
MGTKAKSIVQLDVAELIADLRRAYADEWLAAQGYTYMAQVLAGRPAAERVAAELKKTAEEELEHQDELAERITVLGGTPPKTFEEILAAANGPFPTVPQSEKDMEGAIRVTIAAERGAIEVYQKLAQKCFGKDPLTYELAVHILGEEVEHEDTFENMVS